MYKRTINFSHINLSFGMQIKSNNTNIVLIGGTSLFSLHEWLGFWMGKKQRPTRAHYRLGPELWSMPFWAKTTIDQNNNCGLPIFVIVYIPYSISIFLYSLSLTQ